MTGKWYDASVPLREGMVHWPGDPTPRFEQTRKREGDVEWTVSAFFLGAHAGTHLDAPLHLLPGGGCIDDLPFEAVVGRARVIEIRDRESVKVEELRRYRIRRGERILFKTRNSARCWGTDAFVEDYVFIEPEAARYLVERGARTVGVDYLSVGGFKRGNLETHRALLEAGVCLIEGLNLSGVKGGRYEMVCLPMKLAGLEGAPARVLLRTVGK